MNSRILFVIPYLLAVVFMLLWIFPAVPMAIGYYVELAGGGDWGYLTMVIWFFSLGLLFGG